MFCEELVVVVIPDNLENLEASIFFKSRVGKTYVPHEVVGFFSFLHTFEKRKGHNMLT